MNRSSVENPIPGPKTSDIPAGVPEPTRGFTLGNILRWDLPASLVVFLVAVPLSLGIAAASGAPLMAGMIAAVVGGLIVGAFSGAPLQVSGPAAGLTVTVASLIQQYGWKETAAITAMAGVLQILLGITRLGRAALSLSPSVVYGMLAGIGIIITLSQLHVVLGGHAQSSAWDNFRELPQQIIGHHDDAVLTGMTAIIILIVWPRIPRLRAIPAPLVAVVAATLLAALAQWDVRRVNLPEVSLATFAFPTLPSGGWNHVVLAVCTVAIIASVESMLSAVAVDRIHAGKRANLDRELIAQGIGNSASGLLGGLPITGVIVRSTANVTAGARTRVSTMLHGLWIAVFLFFGTGLLELIPMAALSALLVVVGVKLIDIEQVRTLWRHHEILPYVVTVIGVVVLNLLEGVLLGFTSALMVAFYRLIHYTITSNAESDNRWRVTIRGTLIFLVMSRVINHLRAVPAGRHVILELHIDFLDHSAFETIRTWTNNYRAQGGSVDVEEIHTAWYERAHSRQPDKRKSLPGPLPQWFAPWSDWQTHRLGSESIVTGIQEFEQHTAALVQPFLAALADGQSPQQLFITCVDSRLVPNLITTSGPGDLFCVRNVGNLVPPPGEESSVGAAIEYAVTVLNVPSIVVCGHSNCGAMNATLTGGADSGSQLSSWLKYAETSLRRFGKMRHLLDEKTTSDVDILARVNVIQQLENVRAYPAVAQALAAGRLHVRGMYFDISTARVHLIDPESGTLRNIQSDPEPVSMVASTSV